MPDSYSQIATLINIVALSKNHDENIIRNIYEKNSSNYRGTISFISTLGIIKIDKDTIFLKPDFGEFINRNEEQNKIVLAYKIADNIHSLDQIREYIKLF